MQFVSENGFSCGHTVFPFMFYDDDYVFNPSAQGSFVQITAFRRQIF